MGDKMQELRAALDAAGLVGATVRVDVRGLAPGEPYAEADGEGIWGPRAAQDAQHVAAKVTARADAGLRALGLPDVAGVRTLAADARLLAEACADLLDADGGPYVDPTCSGVESECACPVRHDLDAALRRYVPDLPRRAEARGEVEMRWEDVAALSARAEKAEADAAVMRSCFFGPPGHEFDADSLRYLHEEGCPAVSLDGDPCDCGVEDVRSGTAGRALLDEVAALRAQVADLTRERDEARGLAERSIYAAGEHFGAIVKYTAELKDLRARVAELEARRAVPAGRWLWRTPAAGQAHLYSPTGQHVATVTQGSGGTFYWHTWDPNGVGGENASAETAHQARWEADRAARVWYYEQGWEPCSGAVLVAGEGGGA